jgi:hypothetical protein
MLLTEDANLIRTSNVLNSRVIIQITMNLEGSLPELIGGAPLGQANPTPFLGGTSASTKMVRRCLPKLSMFRTYDANLGVRALIHHLGVIVFVPVNFTSLMDEPFYGTL